MTCQETVCESAPVADSNRAMNWTRSVIVRGDLPAARIHCSHSPTAPLAVEQLIILTVYPPRAVDRGGCPQGPWGRARPPMASPASQSACAGAGVTLPRPELGACGAVGAPAALAEGRRDRVGAVAADSGARALDGRLGDRGGHRGL